MAEGERQPFRGLVALNNEDKKRIERAKNMPAEERAALQQRVLKLLQNGKGAR